MCLQVAAANSSEEGDQDDDDLCIVCWEKMREVIFYHCMHMVRPLQPKYTDYATPLAERSLQWLSCPPGCGSLSALDAPQELMFRLLVLLCACVYKFAQLVLGPGL